MSDDEKALEDNLDKILAEPTVRRNQCMGCQAGWAVVIQPGRFSFSQGAYQEPYAYHYVKGGYRGEIVACTRTLYEDG